MQPLRSSLLLASLASLAMPGLRAQDPAAGGARLQQLLQELGSLAPETWTAREQAIELAARAADDKARALRAEAAKLGEQAAAADAEAKRLRADILRLQELKKLLQVAAPIAPVQPAATAPAEAGASAPRTKPPPSATTQPAEPPKPAAAAAAASDKQPSPPAAAPTAPTSYVDWAAVEPLLQDRCSSCHEPSDKKGGLDVTTFAAVRAGGGSGRTLTPGEPEQSRLWLLVAQQERPFMPKGEDPLSSEQLALLRTWIEQGASESPAAARAFVAGKLAAASAAPMADEHAVAAPGPVPHDLPPLAVVRPERVGAIKALSRSPNASLLAAPGLRQVLLYDAELHPLGTLPIDAAVVEQVAFAADGTQLVAAVGEPGRSGRAIVFDVQSGRVVGTFGQERDVPLGVAVHGRQQLVALGGSGKRVVVLRQGDGSEVATYAHDDFVLALQFSPDGTLLAAGDRSGVVRLWEAGGGGLVETLSGHRGAVHALAFAANGARVFTAGADGTVRGFDPASGKEVWKQQAHDGQALALASGPEGRLASCGSDGRIAVFDAAGKVLGKSPAAGEWLYAVAFGGDGKAVRAGDWQGRLHHFVLGSKDKVMPFTVPLAAPR